MLAGKCAIKVFQEPSAADFFQHSTADFDQMADPVMQACAAAAAAVGGSPVAGCGAASEPGMSGHDLSGMWDQELLQDPYIQQCAAAAPADAGSGNGSSSGLLYIPNNAAPAAPPAAHAAATGASSQYGSGVSSAANNTGDVAYFEPAMEVGAGAKELGTLLLLQDIGPSCMVCAFMFRYRVDVFCCCLSFISCIWLPQQASGAAVVWCSVL